MARKKREKIPPLLFVPIENLGLEKRVLSALKKKDIYFVGELCELSGKEILSIRGIGKASLSAIKLQLWRIDELVPPLGIQHIFPTFTQECARRKAAAQ